MRDDTEDKEWAPLARIQAKRLRNTVFWMELRVMHSEPLPHGAKLKRASSVGVSWVKRRPIER